MPLTSRIRSFWRTLFCKADLDRDLDAELRSYVDELYERYVRDGVPPETARRRVLVETGGVEQVKERVRGTRIGSGADAVAVDVRSAWRQVSNRPGFATIIIVTLALGIGANSAIFSVVHALLVEPLPYREAHRLLFVWSNLTDGSYPRAPLSGPELQDLREGARTLASVGAIWPTTAALTGEGDPEQLRIGLVTANFFSVLGADAAHGRTFAAEDEMPGAAASVVLSWGFWQRRFGADPAVIGRSILINGTPATVVGVMPEAFRLLFPPDASVPDHLQAWAPFPAAIVRDSRTEYYLRTIARLADGATFEEADREVVALGDRIAKAYTAYSASGRSFYTVRLEDDALSDLKPAVLTLFAGVAILLLIACVNVASLLVARAAARRKETALRIAIGAGRGRLARQCLAEGLILAGFGGVAGLVVGRAGLALLIAVRPESVSRIEAARFEWIVLAFTAGIALAWGVLFSLAPLFEVFRARPSEALQRDARRSSIAVHYRLRAALVAVQVALSVVLLIGAGLLGRGFVRLMSVDPGFDAAAPALTFRLALPRSRYRSQEEANAFSELLRRKVAALPGVTGVGAISHFPFDYVPNWSSPYAREGAPNPATMREADARAVTPGALETLGAQLIEGRFFTEADDLKRLPVAIVDDRLAARTWPGESALGKRMRVPDLLQSPATVVGVVRHLRHRTLTSEVREQVYVAVRQSRRNPMAYIVRTSGDPAASLAPVRAVIRELDPELPTYDERPLSAYAVEARATRRFTLTLVAVFAAVALALASVGVYGVLAYSVGQRRHEFGVRLALGARPVRLVGDVLREGLRLAAIGLTGGLAVAFVAARALEGQLFGVTPHDLPTYLGGAGVLLAAAVGACLWPALGATRVSPAEALRAE
jgi:putative ABC transport system permease protein